MRFSKIVFAFSALAVNLCSILAHPVQVEEPLNTGIIPRNITSTNFANVNVVSLHSLTSSLTPFKLTTENLARSSLLPTWSLPRSSQPRTQRRSP